MTIGERIYYCRTENHMTQKQLAEKCGMADSAIRKYESGKITPKFETVKKLAAALDVSVSTLMGYEETEDIFDAMVSPDEVDRETKSLMRQKELLDEINNDFYFLNAEGQEEAAKRIEELTQIPKYRYRGFTETPSDAPGGADDKEPAEK